MRRTEPQASTSSGVERVQRLWQSTLRASGEYPQAGLASSGWAAAAKALGMVMGVGGLGSSDPQH